MSRIKAAGWTLIGALMASQAGAINFGDLGDLVDVEQYDCLSLRVYEAAAGQDAEFHQRAAWIWNNRKQSAEFPSNFCEVEEPGAAPWDETDLPALVRQIRDAADATAAAAQLDVYKGKLAQYHLAQVIAFELLVGWLGDEDPTDGLTELEEPPPPAPATPPAS